MTSAHFELAPFSGRMYSTLIESLRGIVWEADPVTFQFRFVSSHAEALLGFPRAEWIEDPQFWLHHTHPDDLERAATFCKDCIARGLDHDFEYRMIARDGRVVWLRDIVTIDRAEDGSVALRGIMIDITERRRIEDELRLSQERLALAQKSARVGTFDWDMVNDEPGWTPELTELYGDPPLGCPRDTWFQRVHPDDMVKATDAVQDAMESGSLDVEYRVRWPDGAIRWLRARGRASLDAHGRPQRMLGAVMDVTEAKSFEIELAQAKKMEALGRLAGGIAHDFNNLLTIITTYSDMLASSTTDGEARADVAEIQRASAKGVQLTRQLLSFSRRDAVEPQAVRFDAEVADVAGMLERVLPKDVVLQLGLGCGDANVMIGPGQVQQIVMNLALNARDAMPGGGTLTISTECENDVVMLKVSDTGEGMTEDVKSRIFEPFFTTKGEGKGTGWGLPTVFGIVRKANGAITVESRQGEGATFSVRLPAA